MSPSSPRGVIACGDEQSAAAGAEALSAGGNAVDAVVAAAFAAFVVELPLCGPLGGAVATVWAPGEAPYCMDAFARAPGLDSVTPTEIDFSDVEVDFGATTQVFHIGRGAVAVPLALRGLLELHRRHGRLSLSDVVAPATALATRGYRLSPGIAFANALLEPIFANTAECHALISRDGHLAKAGERLDNPELGETLRLLAREPKAADSLYDALAREFGADRGGRIAPVDVQRAALLLQPPLRVQLGAHELITPPAPSMGGVLVALGACLLDESEPRPAAMRAEDVQRLARVQHLLLTQRSSDFDLKIRDPEFVRELLDPARVRSLRAAAVAEPFTDGHLGSTTHLSAADRDGLLVSLTLTNGEGCGCVLSGTGIIANNLLGEEDIHPRGFHHDPPGSALSTMMAPTLVRSGDRAWVLGSGGSNRLRNAILQVVHLTLGQQLPAHEAVVAPRLHVDRHPDGGARIAYERSGLQAEAEAALLGAFPKDPVVFESPNMYFGGVHVAWVDGQSLGGAGDPRRGGCVRVV